MSLDTSILSLITSLTTGHILFLALYLWIKSEKHLPNRILSILLFCYALRIIKSVLLITFPGLSFSELLIALGVIGMTAIGPLLLLYATSVLQNNFTLTKRHFAHFIPAFLLLLTAFFLDNRWMFLVYQCSVYLIFLYLIASIQLVMKWKNAEPVPPAYSWLIEILFAAGGLTVVFLLQLYIRDRSLYIIISIVGAVIFYIISLRAALRRNVFSLYTKKKTNSTTSLLLPAITGKISQDHLFLDPQLTVSKLALALNIPVHTLSAAINRESGMSFNEYLNTFRIKEAAIRMSSPSYSHLGIEGIAYDCGFHSLSAFYIAFKKVYQTTPARYRQNSFPDLANQEDSLRYQEGL